VQTTSARRNGRFNETYAWGSESARIARVSQQCFHENCPQMIEKERWPPNNSPNSNDMETSCLGSDGQSYFETVTWRSFCIKSRTGTNSAGPINNLSQV